MIILQNQITKEQLVSVEDPMFFDGWIKCAADIRRDLLAVNAPMHADLEQLLLDNGSDQHDIYGFNIIFDPWEIEFDSIINAPRNREAGYPREGRGVADPSAREQIEEVVKKWVKS